MLKEPSLEHVSAGHSFSPARGPGGEGEVRGDQLKRLVATKIRAIATFHLVFCFPSQLKSISSATHIGITRMCS